MSHDRPEGIGKGASFNVCALPQVADADLVLPALLDVLVAAATAGAGAASALPGAAGGWPPGQGASPTKAQQLSSRVAAALGTYGAAPGLGQGLKLPGGGGAGGAGARGGAGGDGDAEGAARAAAAEVAAAQQVQHCYVAVAFSNMMVSAGCTALKQHPFNAFIIFALDVAQMLHKCGLMFSCTAPQAHPVLARAALGHARTVPLLCALIMRIPSPRWGACARARAGLWWAACSCGASPFRCTLPHWASARVHVCYCC